MTRTEALEFAAFEAATHVAVEVTCPRKETVYYAWTPAEVASFNQMNRNWDVSAQIITA